MGIKKTIEWFVPDNLKKDLVSFSKAKITISVMFIIALLLLPNAYRGLLIGRPALFYAAIIAAVLMSMGPFLLKKTKSQLIAGNYFLVIYISLLTYVTVFRGGASSYYAINYAQIVVITFLVTNLKYGTIWSVICLTALGSMKFAKDSGVHFNEISSEKAAVNIIVVVLVISILSIVYEWNSTKNLKLFAKEKDKSIKSAEELRKILIETNEVMSGVANGDLSQGIQADVIGDLSKLKKSVNNALKLLGDSLMQVATNSEGINRGTSEISSAAQDLASGSTEQAASVQEISSAMNEISSRANTNLEKASQAQILSNQAVVDLQKGNKQMDTMLKAMNTINETSTNVSKVIKVIDEIAFQTNLLALNAAVEAARAGKYGKGFAVVAEEVRNLAARSSEAAKNTAELIETSIKHVENGVESANVTAETQRNYVETINKINDFVGEISAASKEQTVSVGEINNGLQQVNAVVQRNSSISEETASASEELSSQADELQNLMNHFKLKGSIQPPALVKTQPLKKPRESSLPELPGSHTHSHQKRKKIVLDDNDFGKY